MNALSPKPSSPATPLRTSLSLDGTWQFRHESDESWREARVPAHWQACFEDLAVSFGTATYRRELSIPPEWSGREIAVCFGAVSEIAVIFLNGTEIGRHEGGYLPFDIVLPADLLKVDNVLEVVASLPDAHRTPDMPDFAEIPHGKQSWYGPQGGIWQSVRVEARDPDHIAALRLDPHWPDGRLDITIHAARAASGTVRFEIASPDGATVQRGEFDLDGRTTQHGVTIADIHPWSPDTPNLYRIRAALAVDESEVDIREESFGFRRFEAKDGYLHLNGEPLYLRGALDQDYYPDGFGAPPSLQLLEDQLGKAKAMGLNCLRCHIKIPDPRYYEVADRLGLLIWTEIPNIETFSPASAIRLRQTMEGILARDRNHPSIVIWTLINEDWGTRLREVAEQRQWISDMVDWLRAEDPLRLVVDNSACFPNVHVKTDINDYHFYRTATDRREEWDALCREFAASADWTFSADKEAEWTRKEPLILSEFGVWGLPDPARLRNDAGRDPWWASYGATWADGTALPLGVEARFRELGLAQVFGNFTRFIEDVQAHQGMNLKYEIEVVRSHAPIGGYVITEFTDVHWEGNGLMDMARNPRVFASAMPAFNADVVVIPGTKRHAIRAGETAEFDLKIASGGARLPEGCRLKWRFGESVGEAGLPAVEPMRVHSLPVSMPSDRSGPSQRADVAFELIAPDGRTITKNGETLSVYAPGTGKPVRFHSDDEEIASRLIAIGHEMTEPGQADLVVTHHIDAQTVEAIHAGRRVLQIVAKAPGRLRDDTPPRDGPMSMIIDQGQGGLISGPYFTFPGYSLADRHKSIWRGDWVGNFSWLRRDGAFAHIPGGPLLDLSFRHVVPHQVMTGFRPWEFHGRVHAGLVVGWVHKPAAFIIEKRLGRGKLVATTFRLQGDGTASDPVSEALYDGLIQLAAAREG